MPPFRSSYFFEHEDKVISRPFLTPPPFEGGLNLILDLKVEVDSEINELLLSPFVCYGLGFFFFKKIEEKENSVCASICIYDMTGSTPNALFF